MLPQTAQRIADSPENSPGGAKYAYRSGARPLAGYTIKRGVGHGGFGEVYYATSDAGKEVALKLVRRHLDVELRGVTQCLNLKHPNLLALHDIKQDDQGDSWVVMEYMQGESLEAALARHPHGLPVEESLRWMQGIAAAVGYLHDHGIVHRDLKPGNIFLDEGIVKIGDYGLSKFISCTRRSGQTGSVGTVHYMAPEVANGRYGKEIDIYALGILLYEMLTGRVPFEGESLGEVLMKHLTAEPDLSALSEPYRGVVARALAKDPATRFASVGEMMQTLPRLPGDSPQFAPSGAAPLPTAIPLPPAIAGAPQAFAAVSRREMYQVGRRRSFPATAVIAGLFFAAVLSLPLSLRAAAVHRGPGIAFNPAIALVLIGVFGAALAVRFRRLRSESFVNPQANCRPVPTYRPPVANAGALRAQLAPPLARRAQPVAQRFPPRRESPTVALLVKPARERWADLVGSLLLAGIVAAAVCALMLLAGYKTIEPGAWVLLSLTGALGSWAVLVPSAWWHGVRGQPALRRFVLMLFGMGMGLAVGGLHDWLQVQIPWPHANIPQLAVPGLEQARLYRPQDGSPTPLAFMGYFGFLFLLPRWWRLANPLRAKRCGFWATVASALWAGLIGLFWQMPQPWAVMAAVAISLGVQLASPWQNPRLMRAS